MLSIARLSHRLRPPVSPTQRVFFSDAKKRLVEWPPLARARSGHIPTDQYHQKLPKMFNPRHVLRVYWETIPLFFVTALAVCLAVCATIWSCRKCVDVVFRHNRSNHSHTMDLCNPTVHKIITINQRYLPWPELQCVLNKMKAAEKELIEKVEPC